MTQQPDHEIADLEYDPSIPPRPEEEIADAVSIEAAGGASPGQAPSLPIDVRPGR